MTKAIDNVVQKCKHSVVKKVFKTRTYEHAIEVNDAWFIHVFEKRDEVFGVLVSPSNKFYKPLAFTLTEKSSLNRVNKIVDFWIRESEDEIDNFNHESNLVNENIKKSKELIDKCQKVFGGNFYESMGDYYLSGGLIDITIVPKECSIKETRIRDLNSLIERLK